MPAVAVAALVLLGGAAAYAYYFSGLRTAPPALALATPSAAASSSASTTATAAGTGTWTVGSGSVAGYRVTEQFVGQSSTHEAVARTSAVTGTITIAQSGSTYRLSSGKITVQLAGLASVDSVAGYNVTNRDRIVQQALGVGSFPTAVFAAEPVDLPAGAATGQTVAVSVPGQLTVHGVTKSVTATGNLRVTGTAAQLVATISTNMTDFGVSPPSIGFTTVQPSVTIEVSLNLSPSA